MSWRKASFVSILIFDRVISYGWSLCIMQTKNVPFSRLLNRAQTMQYINMNTLEQESM
jgi:hypothetical protein